MYTVIETEHFSQWFSSLQDRMTKMRLLKRLRKAMAGTLGDCKPVGHGVGEMREFFGPGWRMYYIHQGTTIILMLGGGDKSSQQSDIARAQQLAQELHDEQNQDPRV